MNNLFKKGARWILAIIIAFLVIGVGVWVLPWHAIVQTVISVIFIIMAVIVVFVGLFSSGPQ